MATRKNHGLSAEPAGAPERQVPSGENLLSSAAFGFRIRSLRRSRHLTVEALADLVGVHKTHLSRIERGIKAPSLTMVTKLAQVLESSVGHLVGEATQEDSVVVARSKSLGPRFSDDEQHRFAPIFQNPQAASFAAYVVFPGTTDGPLQAQHQGHEILYVLEGTIEVSFPGRTERLAAGDCVHFPGYLSHRIVRVGRTKARALLVISSA